MSNERNDIDYQTDCKDSPANHRRIMIYNAYASRLLAQGILLHHIGSRVKRKTKRRAASPQDDTWSFHGNDHGCTDVAFLAWSTMGFVWLCRL